MILNIAAYLFVAIDDADALAVRLRADSRHRGLEEKRAELRRAASDYAHEVAGGTFPAEQHSF